MPATSAATRKRSVIEADQDARREEGASFDLLSGDLREAGENLWPNEARFLVDLYYDLQDYRLSSANQVRSLQKAEEPHGVLSGFLDQTAFMEKRVGKVLDYWTNSVTLGQWARSNHGVGPVITAGLMAHIDIERAPTAGAIWRYAGLDPTVKWEKGQTRPWNAQLKTLCWKLGESFTKVSGNENAVYGQLYRERKLLEVSRNEAGKFADQARHKLETTKIGKNTAAYKHYSEGLLPPGRINLRAQRYAVKLFLAHYHEVGYWLTYGEAPPNPYIFSHGEGKHVHRMYPPNFEAPRTVTS